MSSCYYTKNVSFCHILISLTLIIVALDKYHLYEPAMPEAVLKIATQSLSFNAPAPDFAAYAKAFGFWSATVRATHEFAATFEAAVASGKPALIEIITDPDQISPTATLSGIRSAALKPK